jgi:hypothetical protein
MHERRSKMMATETRNQSRLAKVGWVILLGVSALLILAGTFWYMELPEMALDNIAEHANLEPDGFMVGEPSAFDIITLVTRNSSVYAVALGLFALLVAWQGYRYGSRGAWAGMWVLVVAFIAIAVNFTLAAGRIYAPSFGLFAFSVIALVGLLLARKGLAG